MITCFEDAEGPVKVMQHDLQERAGIASCGLLSGH